MLQKMRKSFEKIQNFSRNHPLFVIAVPFVVVLVAILSYLSFLKLTASSDVFITEEIDPASGVTILHINEEPEGENQIDILGFQVFLDNGLTYGQYDTLKESLVDFFSASFPDISRLSYQSSSFHYEALSDFYGDDVLVSVATLITNDDTAYTVKITPISVDEISIDIYDEDGQLLNAVPPEN